MVFDRDARVVSRFVCQRPFSIEENAKDMAALLRWNIYIYIYIYIYVFFPSLIRNPPAPPLPLYNLT